MCVFLYRKNGLMSLIPFIRKVTLINPTCVVFVRSLEVDFLYEYGLERKRSYPSFLLINFINFNMIFRIFKIISCNIDVDITIKSPVLQSFDVYLSFKYLKLYKNFQFFKFLYLKTIKSQKMK